MEESFEGKIEKKKEKQELVAVADNVDAVSSRCVRVVQVLFLGFLNDDQIEEKQTEAEGLSSGKRRQRYAISSSFPLLVLTSVLTYDGHRPRLCVAFPSLSSCPRDPLLLSPLLLLVLFISASSLFACRRVSCALVESCSRI